MSYLQLATGGDDDDFFDFDDLGDMGDLDAFDEASFYPDKKEFWTWVENGFEPPNRHFEKMMSAGKVSPARAKRIFRAIADQRNSSELRPEERAYQLRGKFLEHLDGANICRDGVNLCGVISGDGSFAVTEDEDVQCERHVREKCFSLSSSGKKYVSRRMCHFFDIDDPQEHGFEYPEDSSDEELGDGEPQVRFPIVNEYTNAGLDEVAQQVLSFNSNQDFRLGSHFNYAKVDIELIDIGSHATLPLVQEYKSFDKKMVYGYEYELCALRVKKVEGDQFEFETTNYRMEFRLHEEKVYLSAPTQVVTHLEQYEQYEVNKFFTEIAQLRDEKPDRRTNLYYDLNPEKIEEFLEVLIRLSFVYLEKYHENMDWKPWSDDVLDASWRNNLDWSSYDFVNTPLVEQPDTEDNRNITSPIEDAVMLATLAEYDFQYGPAIIPHHFTMSSDCLYSEDLSLDTTKLRPKIKTMYDRLGEESLGKKILDLKK